MDSIQPAPSPRENSPAFSDCSTHSHRDGNGVKRIIDVQVACDGIGDPSEIAKDIEAGTHANSNRPTSSGDNNQLSKASSAKSDTNKPENEKPFSKPVFNRPTQYLKWHFSPKTILVVVKISDPDSSSYLVDIFMDMAKFLIYERGLKVYVEEWLCHLVECRDPELAKLLNAMPPVEPTLADAQHIPPCVSQLLCYEKANAIDEIADEIDMIICLGGDGTLLHVNSLFQKLIPPVLPFYAGSLGFLMTLPTAELRERLDAALVGKVRLTLRTRFCCVVYKTDSVQPCGGSEESKMGVPSPKFDPPPGSVLASHAVMNEVVIERGQSPFLTNLDLYADNRFLTKVQADGIIIATPTGSTAYSMAAGGSMVHPSVPCIVVTPICPHSLSFRPIILPANMEVRVSVSKGSRAPAFVSFDGRNRCELPEGYSLFVKSSVFPMPTVMATDSTADWFHSLSHCLHWNVRFAQGDDSAPPMHPLVRLSDKEKCDTEKK